MGEVASYPVGTFSWVDLGTTDVEGAKAFYGELFGWQTEDMRSSQGSYTMCRLHGRDVAGIHEHAPDDGVGWGSSISVDDVDRVSARARELGATVLAEPFDVQGAGRTAVLQDPSGAVVSLWQPRGHAGAGLVNEVGTWTWNELVTPDLAAARAFYAELFGWGAQDIPGEFPRASFSLGDLLVGGGHAPTPQEGRRRAGPSRSGWPTPTRVRYVPRSWAGRCCCRPSTSPSAASRSSPTRPGRRSASRPCPAGPSAAWTAPDRGGR
jgi:predicted enzyme related to lactoylglutathione lyase